jgi:hypothetical protein
MLLHSYPFNSSKDGFGQLATDGGSGLGDGG